LLRVETRALDPSPHPAGLVFPELSLFTSHGRNFFVYVCFLYQTILWYRAAELKHSRVAMLATAGWLINAAGVSFPGDLTYGTKFSSLSHLPHEAWDVVPYAGKLQMLLAVGAVEFISETKKVKSAHLRRTLLPLLSFPPPSPTLFTFSSRTFSGASHFHLS